MLHFSRPALIVLLAVLPWFWWRARHAGTTVPANTLALRLSVAALLILAASGLEVRIRDGDVAVIYALDRSGSMTAREQAGALARINGWSGSMRGRDRAGAVVFGGDSVLERTLSERLRVAEVASRVSPSATNISSAIALARSALPPAGSRRIVVLSDGCETAGNALEAAAFAAADGIAIDAVLPVDANARAPVRATRVVVPTTVRVREPFLVSVEFEGRPGGRGELTIRRDGLPLLTQPVVVAADGTGSISVTDAHDRGGLYTYRATLQDELDEVPEERGSDAGAIVSVAGEPTVLFVTASGPSIQAALSAGGFRVIEIAPDAMPATVSALAAFDAIVLDDVPSELLTEGQAAAIARYVDEHGGGLLLLGSPRSLGAAGYSAGPLGQVLPVDLRPRAGRRTPSMALVFVFDKSGSMADIADGVPKIELARAAAMKILEVVPPSDSIGVIAFDSEPTVVAPMAPAQDPVALAARLRALTPGGPTAMASAVGLALGWLRDGATAVSRRHLLLLSDGRTPPADADRLRELLRGQGVQLSVVAVGADADRTMLERLAQSTGGRAYFPTDIRQLPLIVAREAARSSGGTLVEEPYVLRADSHAILTGIDREAMPGMGGYVVGTGKPGSEMPLKSHLDDPVLSAWHAGLGKVAVYTGDLASPWSAQLRRWKDAPRLWSQTTRWLHRRLDDEGLSATLTETQDGASLVVESQEPDGRFISGLDVRVTLRTPDGTSYETALAAASPGQYATSLPMGPAGPYIASIVARSADRRAEQRVLRGFFWTGSREQRACAGASGLLARVAEIAGGRILKEHESPFDGPRRPDYRDAGPWLSAAALLLFFFGLAGRALRGLRPRAWVRRPPGGKNAQDEQAA